MSDHTEEEHKAYAAHIQRESKRARPRDIFSPGWQREARLAKIRVLEPFPDPFVKKAEK